MTLSPSGPDHSRWRPWFVVSIITVVASLCALAWVSLDALDDDEPTAVAPNTNNGSFPPPVDDTLQVWIDPATAFELPAELELEVVTVADDADIQIASEGDGVTFTAHHLVPVASLYTGVDALTLAQLQAIYRGEITDWYQVGGLPGPITIGSVPAAGSSLATPQPVAPQLYETFEALRVAMTPSSGILAVIPIDEVTIGVTAISLDGVDIVRGVGDPAAWPLSNTLTLVPTSDDGEDAAPGLATALEASFPTATTVVATGDILQSRCSLAEIEATGDWAAALRGPVGDYLAAADIALGSLDGSIQDINPVYRCESTTNLSSPPEVMAALTLAGFDGLTLATNHTLDCGTDFCGTDALTRTIELVSAAGIKTYGAGANLDAALAPVTFEVNGVTFGVLGFDDVAAYVYEATADTPGTAPLDDSYASENAAGDPAFFHPASELDLVRFEAAIRSLDATVDVVVVQVQSGIEDTHTPSERSIKALRVAAAAGADLIVGNQAHWAQAVETRGDAWVSYALGNFIFDQVHTPEHTQGYLLEATFWGPELVNVRLVPYQIEGQYKPTFVTGDLRIKILTDVFTASSELPAE